MTKYENIIVCYLGSCVIAKNIKQNNNNNLLLPTIKDILSNIFKTYY